MSSKMDRQGARTAADIEQKYNFGKSFAEVMGIAKDAQETAQKAVSSSVDLDDSLTAEEIFNRLTNNGEAKGLFRDDDGNLYFNADYIRALETMFAKKVSLSAEVFLEPEQEELDTIQKHILEIEFIPLDKIGLYDFNNDGKITTLDSVKAKMAAMGVESLADWSGAVKTKVTMTLDMSNPNKFIRIQGKNMWGRDVDKYIGVTFTNIKNAETEQKLEELSQDYIVESGWLGAGWYGEKWASGKAVCWGTVQDVEMDMMNPYGNLFYDNCTITFPSDFFINTPSYAGVQSLSGTGLIGVSVARLSKDTVWLAVSNSKETNITMSFMVYAIGEWK